MKRSWVCVLMALTLVAGATLVACGGGNDNKATPTAVENQGGNQGGNEATPTSSGGAKATTKATAGNGGSSGGSIGDVPVYPGATNLSTSEFSGSQAGGMLGSLPNGSDFTKVQLAIYETSDSAQQVMDWYKDKMSGWDSAGTFSSGSGDSAMGYAAWTKDNGTVAAYLTASEESGKTTLSIMYGTQ